MINKTRAAVSRIAHAPLSIWFWALVLGTYAFFFLTTIDAVLLKLAGMNLALKLLELPLYATAYALLLPSIKSIYSLLLYPLLSIRFRVKKNQVLNTENCAVVLLYPTYDDFNSEALSTSMAQTLPFSNVYILDDSKDASYKAQADAFAQQHVNVEVIRRRTNGGFKAGNMNAFLRQREDFEFFVVVDADQRLAPNFLERATAMMATSEHIGIVQSRPVARTVDSRFARTYAPIFNAYIKTSQLVRTRTGFSMFMGRGALIRKIAYDRVGGFPELVMEDVPFSFELAEIGYKTVYEEELVSYEEYPVNYVAFRKQQRKTAEGNTEFLKRYWFRILTSKLPLSQRADLLAEHSFMIAGSIFGILLFLSNIFYRAEVLPGRMLLLFALAGLVPILPGALSMLRTRWFFLTPVIFLRTMFLYGSTLRSSLMGILKVLYGRTAVFHITPKTTSSALVAGRTLNSERAKDAKYIIYLALLSFVLTGSIFSAIAFSLPIIAAFFSGLVLYQGLEIGGLMLLGLTTAWSFMRRYPQRVLMLLIGLALALGGLALSGLSDFRVFYLLLPTAIGMVLLLTLWLRYYAKSTFKAIHFSAQVAHASAQRTTRSFNRERFWQRLRELLDVS